MATSSNQLKISPELIVVNGASSSVNGADSVDPRWPLLNRWSYQKASKFSTVAIPPFVPKQAAASSLVSDQTGAVKAIKDKVINLNTSIEFSSLGDMNVLKPSTFSSSLGAWKKPMSILSPQQETERTHVHEPNNSDWPALSHGKLGTDKPPTSVKDVAKISGQLEAQQVSLKAHSKEYPWAARMNQSLRNLHRVTIPEYMKDGTPKVRIPSHVLLGGLENQKEFVVGQFYRCLAPTGGHIQAVVTRIWGRKCRIFTRKLGESTYLFHIPDESTRKWVIQRGLWHVDDCLLFVSPWSLSDTISIPEITTVHVWLTLLNIPDQLYSILGIKWIASGIGEPLLTDKPWLDPTQMGKAKILVEVKLDKPFPKRVALIDKSDSITMVDVLYSWLPSTCSGCGQLGHKASRCLLLSEQTSQPLSITTSGDADASKSAMCASPTVVKADVTTCSTTMESGKHLSKETLESSPVLISPTIMETTTSPVQAGTNVTSPTTLSLPVTTGTTSNSKSATKTPLNEVSTAKHVTPPSVKADADMRMSLSSLAMSTNRFASLDSSDDDGSDDDNEIPASNDTTDPVEFLTFDKRILRERPVKQSEKAKKMRWQHATGGRGNRGRGKRGGRG